MSKDIRNSPRGLIAPLSQAALGALRSLQEGLAATVPEEHRGRLLDLQLIEVDADGGARVTALGRERLTSDR